MISFIIVTYNSADTIAECLNSIITDQSHDHEIIVVDNASSDATRQIVRSFTQVHLIALKNNVGFSGANQIGTNSSRGDLLVFLNPDATIQSQFSVKVNNAFNANPDIGILGCRILDEDGTPERTEKAFPTFFSLLYEHSLYKHLFPRSPSYRRFIMDDWDRTTPRVIDVIAGACFVMQQEVLTQIGGFDTEYFLYFEELDLSRRIQKIGKKTFFEPTIIVRHLGQTSTDQIPTAKRQAIYNASCHRYITKYHGELWAFLFWASVKLFNFPKFLVTFGRNIRSRKREKYYSKH